MFGIPRFNKLIGHDGLVAAVGGFLVPASSQGAPPSGAAGGDLAGTYPNPTLVNTALAFVKRGAGSPEGAVTAGVGTMYLRSDGGANTSLYIKESGAGNTGWAAK